MGGYGVLWEGMGKKDHLVKWEDVYKPKSMGGLVIGHI